MNDRTRLYPGLEVNRREGFYKTGLFVGHDSGRLQGGDNKENDSLESEVALAIVLCANSFQPSCTQNSLGPITGRLNPKTDSVSASKLPMATLCNPSVATV